MRSTYRRIGEGALRRLLAGTRGQAYGGIAIAIVSAGLAAGCSSTASVADNAGYSRTLGNSHSARTAYSFRTLDNTGDLTFNQLLGVNNRGVIAGYLGSGAAGHPNKGYMLTPTRAGFAIRAENFPRSVQTQVTGLNDRGVTVGFWSGMNTASAANDNFGFYSVHGRFRSVNFPTRNNSKPPVNQLLGVNNQDVAVGFYTDAAGNSHGYTFRISGHVFRTVRVAGASSVTAAAINNRGDVAGFFTSAAGATDAFLRTSTGRVRTLAFPGASMTQALGVNDFREVVGTYTAGTGDNAKMHGFTWTPQRGFQTVDDPHGAGTTTINGVNDLGEIVGFYVDGGGNTDGFAAVSRGHRALPGLIAPATPAPSMSPSPSSPAPSMPASSTSSPAPSTPPTAGATPSPTPTPAGPTHV